MKVDEPFDKGRASLAVFAYKKLVILNYASSIASPMKP